MAVNYRTPGIYVEELPGGPRPIEAVGTSTAGFVGVAPLADAPRDTAVAIGNWSQFVRTFVGDSTTSTPLVAAVFGFFQNGGRRCYVVNVGEGEPIGGGRRRRGLDVLAQVDEVAIVAAPGYVDPGSHDALLGHCESLRDRVAILDLPPEVPDLGALTRVASVDDEGPATPPPPDAEAGEEGARAGGAAGAGAAGGAAGSGGGGGRRPAGDDGPAPGVRPRQSDGGYGAAYFPWIRVRDPLGGDATVEVPPSGHLAGVWARTDAMRGVHKAPANESIRGALGLTYVVTDAEQEELNPAGVNCLRLFTREGIRVWGARTLADGSSEWRYLNVRRLFNMIEESIVLSTRWIVFEPNDRTLWKSIRRDVTAFLMRLWRDGALMGRTPEEAFFVQCDEETNPPEVIDAGQVITVIGIAPVKPAEFIVFRVSQHSAGSDVETGAAVNV